MRATWALCVLVLVGVGLRLTAILSWWPVAATMSDSIPFAVYAGDNPLADPQHPAGYPALLALTGLVTNDVAAPVLLQHAGGVVAALLLYAATRRLTGSGVVALAPAAAVLLSGDQIFLEHTIMSEAPFVVAIAGALYATVRALDEPLPWWKWPALAGALAAVATVIRSAGLFLIPVLVVGLLLSHPRPWRPHWRAPGALAAVAGALLLCYAVANLVDHGRFEVGPTQGWHLYGRVAPFADCGQFDPPKGTERLCETTPMAQRPGNDFYLYDPSSPAVRAFGPDPWDEHDAELGRWARAAIVAQPRAYADVVLGDTIRYFVPSARTSKDSGGTDLDPQLDWTALTPGYDEAVAANTAGMEVFFDDIDVDKTRGPIAFLHDWQRVFRFGGTLLTLCTVLVLLGLLTGPRRSRIGVLLFGAGGLALLVAPSAAVFYTARYSVPLAGPIAAAAAISAWGLWRLEAGRRRNVAH